MKYYMIIILMLLIGCAKEVADTVEPSQPVPVAQPAESVEYQVPVVIEVAKPDPTETVGYTYIVRQGDWLSTIARDELGNVDLWTSIALWNRAIIDAPHLIYPYTELVLHKIQGSGTHYRYGFDDYRVRPGDTLWSIAAAVYGDNYAWVVLMRDNIKYLPYGPRKMEPGLRLIVRTNL